MRFSNSLGPLARELPCTSFNFWQTVQIITIAEENKILNKQGQST
jgi:hypothetical protein